jgi:hypothetical protein
MSLRTVPKEDFCLISVFFFESENSGCYILGLDICNNISRRNLRIEKTWNARSEKDDERKTSRHFLEAFLLFYLNKSL